MATTVVPSERGKTTNSQRALLTSIFMLWLVGLVDKFAFGTILTDRAFLSELGLTGHATALGALVSIAVLTQAMGNALFGWAVDRYGPRRCALVGITGWILSCVLAALAHSLFVLVISRVLLGLCEGYTWPVGNALTARWFRMDRRAKARALWMSATCVGPGISGFLTAGLLGAMSWRGVFWSLAVISLVVCLPLILLFVRDTPPGERAGAEAARAAQPGRTGARPAEADPVVGPASVLRRANFWFATLAASGTTIGVWAMASWLPSYLVGYRHTAPHTFQYYVLTAYVLGLVIMIGYSRVVDRLRRRTIWLAVALWSCALLLLVIGLVPAAPYLVLIAVTIAIIYGVTLLHAQGFQDQLTSVHRVGTENGLMNAVSNVLAGVVPFAMGGLIDVAGGAYSLAFGLLFVLLAVCGGSALVMYRRGF